MPNVILDDQTDFHEEFRNLPPIASEMQEREEKRRAKISALYAERMERLQKLRDKRDGVNAEITQMHRTKGQNLTANDKKRLDDREAYRDELQREIIKLSNTPAYEPPKMPRGLWEGGVEAWLSTKKPGRKYVEQRGDSSVRRGQTIPDALAKTREKNYDLLRERKAVINAHLPFDDVQRALIADIEAKAKAGKPNFLPLLKTHPTLMGTQRLQGNVVWPKNREWSGVRAMEFHRSAELTCWLFKDAILSKALEELRAAHDPDRVIPLSERPARIAKIEAEIRALEYREVALVCAAEDSGHEVEIRHGIHPMALLQIREAAPGEVEDFTVPDASEGFGALVDYQPGDSKAKTPDSDFG